MDFMEFLTPAFWVAVGQIILIDILLGGDNAVVIALACRKLPGNLRTKGILAYPNEDRRFAFQAVHMIADGDFIGPWQPGADRRSKLVFIGRNLNRPLLRRGFEACQVPA